MRLRLQSMGDVRAFTMAVTAAVLLGNLGLQELLLPHDIADQIRFAGTAIALTLAALMAFLVGLKLREVYRLTLDLEHAARHDPLTGAMSRRSFYDRAAMLGAGPLTVIVVDIDHFKAVNDRFGHLAGDAALRQVATTLMRNCRAEDLVARFGGEEFIILLSGVPTQTGVSVAWRLCDRLRETPVTVGEATIPVTASFGVAGVAAGELDAGIARADAALYAAKGAGRDRVCAAHGTAPPAAETLQAPPISAGSKG